MMVSGFFSCKSTKTVAQKPTKLVLQVMLISAAFYIASSVLNESFSVKSFIRSLIPSNYFVILYVVVYLISPYLNILYERMNTRFIVILSLIFSGYPTVVDIFEQLTNKSWDGLSSIGLGGSHAGYTIVNFVLMYLVGMYIRKEQDKIAKLTNTRLLTIFGLSFTTIVIWSMITNTLGLSTNLAWEYCNPLVIIEAGTVFILFLRLNIGHVKWINQLSKATFTVFLCHSYFITHIKVEWAVQQNSFVLIMHMVISAILIYLFCYCVYLVYNSIMRIVLKKLDSKEIVITKL